ncbi:alpha/beta hydrolase [Streptomonospora sp. S1-112]|uniref:Alpha/beta hydrolase n=1 Tax=Streptomonospora mangrovi TaxID=2883123 RepID=A0A9X3NX15_9ACTN|nr:alpha/beta hydrolase [Streptomonospora mangrovi]MDA0565881.1 alpha/beta hydrolase [Streptomonospora mangrovi]
MPRNDPVIDRRAARRARMFQAVFPLMHRLMYASPKVRFATRPIARPTTVRIPTRHGDLRTIVYAPTAADIAAQKDAGHLPPVHLITHGGAFIIRVPEQEDNVARYLASEVGCYVVIPDYDTAPAVRFPVSEEESYDAYRWVREHGARMGWDGDRVTVGGASAGGKLALNVALTAIDEGYPVPLAVSSEYGVADMSRPDSTRTSAKRNPVVAPSLMRLVRATYFKDAPLDTPLASPALHPRLAELPPTLIETAEFDTLRHESNALAADLAAKGVRVTHREFAGVDHGFTHTEPAGTAREAITLLGDHLAAAFAGALRAR